MKLTKGGAVKAMEELMRFNKDQANFKYQLRQSSDSNVTDSERAGNKTPMDS